MRFEKKDENEELDGWGARCRAPAANDGGDDAVAGYQLGQEIKAATLADRAGIG